MESDAIDFKVRATGERLQRPRADASRFAVGLLAAGLALRVVLR